MATAFFTNILARPKSEKKKKKFIGEEKGKEKKGYTMSSVGSLNLSLSRSLVLPSKGPEHKQIRHTQVHAIVSSSELVFVASERHVVIHNKFTNQILHSLSYHSLWVTCLVYLPERKLLLSGSQDASIVLWDIERLTPIRVFRCHSQDVTQIVVVGETLYSSSLDGTIAASSLVTGDVIKVFSCASAAVNRFIVDGINLYAATSEGVMLFSVRGLKRRVLPSGEGPVYEVFDIAIDKDNHFLYAVGSVCCAWPIWKGHVERRSPRLVFDIGESAIGRVCRLYEGVIYIGTSEGNVEVFDGIEAAYLQTFERHTAPIVALALSDEDTSLANVNVSSDDETVTGHNGDREISFSDNMGGEVVDQKKKKKKKQKSKRKSLLALNLSSSKVIKRRPRLISCSIDKSVCVWRLLGVNRNERGASGELKPLLDPLLHQLRGHEKEVMSVFLDQRHRLLFSLGADHDAYVWDMKNSFRNDGKYSGAVAVILVVTDDGTNSGRIFFGDENGMIVCWNAHERKIEMEFDSGQGPLQALVFYNGHLFSAGRNSGQIRKWLVEPDPEVDKSDPSTLEYNRQRVPVSVILPFGPKARSIYSLDIRTGYLYVGGRGRIVKVSLANERVVNDFEKVVHGGAVRVYSTPEHLFTSSSEDRFVAKWTFNGTLLATHELPCGIESVTAKIVYKHPRRRSMFTIFTNVGGKSKSQRRGTRFDTPVGGDIELGESGRVRKKTDGDDDQQEFDLQDGVDRTDSYANPTKSKKLIRVDHDESILYFGGSDGSIYGCSMENLEMLYVCTCHDGPVTALCMGETSDTLVSSSMDRRLVFWDTSCGQVRHMTRSHSDPVRSILVKGNLVYSASTRLMSTDMLILNKLGITLNFREHNGRYHALGKDRFLLQGTDEVRYDHRNKHADPKIVIPLDSDIENVTSKNERYKVDTTMDMYWRRLSLLLELFVLGLCFLSFELLQVTSFAFTIGRGANESEWSSNSANWDEIPQVVTAMSFFQTLSIPVSVSSEEFAYRYYLGLGGVGAFLMCTLTRNFLFMNLFLFPSSFMANLLWHICRISAFALSTVFAVPILYVLMLPFSCRKVILDDSTTEWLWRYDDSIVCWEGDHLRNTIISTFVVPLYLVMAFRLVRVHGVLEGIRMRWNIFNWSHDKASHSFIHPFSKDNSYDSILLLMVKFIFVTSAMFIAPYDDKAQAVIQMIVFYLFGVFIPFIMPSFFSVKVNMLRAGLTWVSLTCFIAAGVTHIQDNKETPAHIDMFILAAAPFILVLGFAAVFVADQCCTAWYSTPHPDNDPAEPEYVKGDIYMSAYDAQPQDHHTFDKSYFDSLSQPPSYALSPMPAVSPVSPPRAGSPNARKLQPAYNPSPMRGVARASGHNKRPSIEAVFTFDIPAAKTEDDTREDTSESDGEHKYSSHESDEQGYAAIAHRREESESPSGEAAQHNDVYLEENEEELLSYEAAAIAEAEKSASWRDLHPQQALDIDPVPLKERQNSKRMSSKRRKARESRQLKDKAAALQLAALFDDDEVIGDDHRDPDSNHDDSEEERKLQEQSEENESEVDELRQDGNIAMGRDASLDIRGGENSSPGAGSGFGELSVDDDLLASREFHMADSGPLPILQGIRSGRLSTEERVSFENSGNFHLADSQPIDLDDSQQLHMADSQPLPDDLFLTNSGPLPLPLSASQRLSGSMEIEHISMADSGPLPLPIQAMPHNLSNVLEEDEEDLSYRADNRMLDDEDPEQRFMADSLPLPLGSYLEDTGDIHLADSGLVDIPPPPAPEDDDDDEELDY